MLSGHAVNEFPVLWAFNAYVVNEAEYIIGDLGLQDKGDVVIENGYQISPSHRVRVSITK